MDSGLATEALIGPDPLVAPPNDEKDRPAMHLGQTSWQFWAVLSALFAALTAIFAKIGVENVNSDLATLIRTLVVICVLALIVSATGQLQDPTKISGRTYLFLVLSGLGTGASWLCYFRALKLGNAAQVAPIDKLSVVMVAILGVVLLGEKLSVVNWLGVLLVAGGAILVALP
jgi:bacterial/archaeal transporter family protein